MSSKDSKTPLTIPEISFLIFHQIVEQAVAATKTIENKIIHSKRSTKRKLLGVFRMDETQYIERIKLNFDLLIPHITVAIVEAEADKRFNSHVKPIIYSIVDLHHEVLKTTHKEIKGGVFDGNYFVPDIEERRLILKKLEGSNYLPKDITLPRMGLSVVSDCLFEKRLNEYRKIWISDMQRQHQAGFIALMPSKVYEHWSGKDYETNEGLIFNMCLTVHLTSLTYIIQQLFSATTIVLSK